MGRTANKLVMNYSADILRYGKLMLEGLPLSMTQVMAEMKLLCGRTSLIIELLDMIMQRGGALVARCLLHNLAENFENFKSYSLTVKVVE